MSPPAFWMDRSPAAPTPGPPSPGQALPARGRGADGAPGTAPSPSRGRAGVGGRAWQCRRPETGTVEDEGSCGRLGGLHFSNDTRRPSARTGVLDGLGPFSAVSLLPSRRRKSAPPPAPEISSFSRMRAFRSRPAELLPFRISVSSRSRSSPLSRTIPLYRNVSSSYCYMRSLCAKRESSNHSNLIETGE